MPYFIKLVFLVNLFTILFSATITPRDSSTKAKINRKNVQAQAIYYNGHIITMNIQNQNPAFIGVKEGKILVVGMSENQMHKYIGKQTKQINLDGKTLIPGLIDAHSHFSHTATRFAQGFNISPPPFGPAFSISRLLDSIKNYIQINNIPAGQTIFGNGYNDLDMEQLRHPTRYQLDSVSAVNPIVLVHFSGHIITANSLALQLVNYTSSASAPQGGILDTFPNGTLTGVCRQYAILSLQFKFQKKFNQLNNQQLTAASNLYLSCGVTTAQDMLVKIDDAQNYFNIIERIPLDINGYFWINSPNLTSLQYVIQNYNVPQFKTRGAKFILDGSIQGYTGLFTKPYWVPQSMYSNNLTNYTYDQSRSCQTQYCGLDIFPAPTLLRSLFQVLITKNIDVHAHCNGDLAAENMIQALEWARNNSNIQSETRFTMIHAQTVTDLQLDKFSKLGLNPSFFPAHLYYWGDKHYNIFLGPSRANRMNPAGSALRRGLRFTLHNDSPVVLAGLFDGVNTFLKLISAAVNRVTLNGRILDDGSQKIPIYQALKAVTINSAWQSHEQKDKGSIEVGKVADFAILNKNPLLILPNDLDSLKVLATIKRGKLVFGNLQNKLILSEI